MTTTPLEVRPTNVLLQMEALKDAEFHFDEMRLDFLEGVFGVDKDAVRRCADQLYDTAMATRKTICAVPLYYDGTKQDLNHIVAVLEIIHNKRPPHHLDPMYAPCEGTIAFNTRMRQATKHVTGQAGGTPAGS